MGGNLAYDSWSIDGSEYRNSIENQGPLPPIFLLYIINLEPNCQYSCSSSCSSSEIVAKYSQPPQNICRPLKAFACVKETLWGVAIVVVVCGKNLW